MKVTDAIQKALRILNPKHTSKPKAIDQLVIIGARGWGREILWAFREYEASGELAIKGFLDDDIHALDGCTGCYPPILNSVEAYEVQPNDVFFCALGDPVYRRKYAEIIERKGGRFISYISKHAMVNDSATIGDGSFIGRGACISDCVKIGRHSRIEAHTVLGHDVVLGDYTSLDAFVFVGGYGQIGDNTIVHAHSAITAHKKVGNDAMVGIGSVIIRNIKDGAKVFGNPARELLD